MSCGDSGALEEPRHVPTTSHRLARRRPGARLDSGGCRPATDADPSARPPRKTAAVRRAAVLQARRAARFRSLQGDHVAGGRTCRNRSPTTPPISPDSAPKKLPIVVWGNGACINAGNRFRQFLTEIASHGYLVVSGGSMADKEFEVGPQENPAPRPPGRGRGPARGSAAPGSGESARDGSRCQS